MPLFTVGIFGKVNLALQKNQRVTFLQVDVCILCENVHKKAFRLFKTGERFLLKEVFFL